MQQKRSLSPFVVVGVGVAVVVIVVVRVTVAVCARAFEHIRYTDRREHRVIKDGREKQKKTQP